MHFTARSGWLNDPNGLVYLDGRYHLYYQYNPHADVWGDIHWGHASSADLLHWEHHPIALAPDPGLGMAFSGSAVVHDRALHALFTHSKEGRQVQSLATSRDGGQTFVAHAHNPVIDNPGHAHFRDPKVLWHAGRWIMVLAVGDHVAFYSSPDLIRWRHESDFGAQLPFPHGVWECPDLVDFGTHHALIVSLDSGGPNGGSSGTLYFLGDFDGRRFRADGPARWLEYGPDSYAGVTFSGTSTPILIAWMSSWRYANRTPTTGWRGAMTLPRRLSLADTRLQMTPATPAPTTPVNPGTLPTAFEVEATLDGPFHLNLDGIRLSIADDEITLDRGATRLVEGMTARLTAPLEARPRQVRVVVDACSIEVFTAEAVLTALVFPKTPLSRLVCEGAEARITSWTQRAP